MPVGFQFSIQRVLVFKNLMRDNYGLVLSQMQYYLGVTFSILKIMAVADK